MRLALVFALALAGCPPRNDYYAEYRHFVAHVTPEHREWVLSCLHGAGGGGESEPEDWMWRCVDQMHELFGPRIWVANHYTREVVVPCATAEGDAKKACKERRREKGE